MAGEVMDELTPEQVKAAISAFCACMGPQGNDPMCPCQMRNAGLEPHNSWTPEAIAELDAALGRCFGWEAPK